MPDNKKTFNPILEETVSPNLEPTITEQKQIVKEKPKKEAVVEKQGQCGVPVIMEIYGNDGIMIKLKHKEGDLPEIKIDGGDWQKYENPVPLEYQKATRFIQARCVSPTKHDSDVIKMAIG